MARDSIDNSYDDETGVFIHLVIGNPGPDELNDAVEWRNEHPSAGQFNRIIWDLTQADLKSTDIGSLVQVFQNARDRLGGGQGRIAIVAPKPVEFGRSRQYEAVAGDHPYEIMVLDSMADALSALAGTPDHER